MNTTIKQLNIADDLEFQTLINKEPLLTEMLQCEDITVREYHELRKQLLIDVFDNGESLTPEEFEEYKKLIATELVFMKMD